MTLENCYAAINCSDRVIVACTNTLGSLSKVRSTSSRALTRATDDSMAESLSRNNITVKLWERSINRKPRTSTKVKVELLAATAACVFEWMNAYTITKEGTSCEVVRGLTMEGVTWMKTFSDPINIDH